MKTASSVLASDISYDHKNERVTVTFPEDAVSIQAGQNLRLGFRFESELEGSMMGYYKSTYENSEGEKAYYALTQFEPTAARRAFPCFDEPDIKATFELTLLSRKGLTALANMPVEHVFPDVGEVALFPEEVEAAIEEAHGRTPRSAEKGPNTLGTAPALPQKYSSREPSPFRGHAELASDASEGDGWVAYTFQTTPKVSTYLVAWANGDFRHLESSYTSPLSGRKVPLRIYTTPEHIHQAGLGLDVKCKVLPVYEKIFDIEYPLPKLDTLVASDFDAGAMENWGLITGRTIVYLFDEKNGSVDAKKLVASVQSHEVAHQW
jgi:aminopeptidase 2